MLQYTSVHTTPDPVPHTRVSAPSFQRLEQALARDYNLLREDLRDGTVFSDADALLVLPPGTPRKCLLESGQMGWLDY